MNNSMIQSATSLYNLQKRLDIIANNIANLNTVGYKRKDATFQDLLSSYKTQHEDKLLPGRLTPPGLMLNWGSAVSAQLIDMSQGALQETGRDLDVALEGNAMFELNVIRLDENGEPVLDEDGNAVIDRMWTRHGSFQLTFVPGDEENAYLATEDGILLTDEFGFHIAVPKGQSIVIDRSGMVAAVDEATNSYTEIGMLRMVELINPQLLREIGNNRYALAEGVDPASAVRLLEDPGMVAAAGVAVHQGFLEQSNVNLAAEMTELLAVQRAYQLSARALQSADMMKDLANRLRG